MKIAFLHTSPVHVKTFNRLLANSGHVTAVHNVKADWLAEVQATGLSADLQGRVSNFLGELADSADVVICTCSSLGPAVTELGRPTIFRVDEPMMKAAVGNAPVLLTLCLASTVESSASLLERSFSDAGLQADYQTLLCGNAWRHFEDGNQDLFGLEISSIIRNELSTNKRVGCVVLAQASMSAALPHLRDVSIPVYAAPELAIEQAMALAQAG